MKQLVIICLILLSFSFTWHDLPLGIYATHKGTTAICLELMPEQHFKMILSTCNEDNVEEGTFEMIGSELVLTSNAPPRMVMKNMRPADSSLGEGIILNSSDPILLSKTQMSLDDGQSKFNFPYQSTPFSFEKNIILYFDQMEPLIIEKQVAEDITTWQVDIVFENTQSTFSEFQSWIIEGKKLRLNVPQSEVLLKKCRKCWLY